MLRPWEPIWIRNIFSACKSERSVKILLDIDKVIAAEQFAI